MSGRGAPEADPVTGRLAVFAAVLGLLALALGPAIAAGRFWAAIDGMTFYFPHRVMAAAGLLAGELPTWNPYGFGGLPFFATIQPGLLFPGNWPFLLLPASWAQDATIALAVGGAIASTYLFARALALPREAAMLAGVTFGLGGFVTAHVEHLPMIQVAALAPLLLWAIERFARDGARRHAIAAAAIVAGMVLAGAPQITAYGLLLATAYALYRALDMRPRERRAFLGPGVAAGVLGLGLAAVQLVPLALLVPGTQRGAWGPFTFTFASPPPEGLFLLFAPYLFGARQPAWPFSQPFFGVVDWLGYFEGYCGIAALLLALVALGRWRLERQVLFWALVAGIGVVLALGRHTPVATLVSWLPVLNKMRYPARHFFEVDLAVAMLAAHGLAWLRVGLPGDAATRRLALRTASALVIGAGALLVAGLAAFGGRYAARLAAFVPGRFEVAQALSPLAPGAWLPLALGLLAAGLAWRLVWRRDGRGGAALVALAAADMLLYGHLQGMTYALPQRPAETLQAPWPDRAAGRELTLTQLRFPECLDCDRFAYLQRLRYPNLSIFAGTATVNGYDAFVPGRYGRLLGMDSFGHAGELDEGRVFSDRHRALDLLGCRLVRLEPRVAAEPAWRARMGEPRWAQLPDEDGLVVLVNRRALPLGWRVAGVSTLGADQVDARVTGAAPGFDPARTALLDAPDRLPGPYARGPVRTAWAGRATLKVVTAGVGPGVVVVSEGYDPGWTATLVAGRGAPRPLPVVRADGLVMAVPVPGGPCTVELRYRPRGLVEGLVASGVSLAVLVGWAFRRSRRRGPAGGRRLGAPP